MEKVEFLQQKAYTLMERAIISKLCFTRGVRCGTLSF